MHKHPIIVQEICFFHLSLYQMLIVFYIDNTPEIMYQFIVLCFKIPLFILDFAEFLIYLQSN